SIYAALNFNGSIELDPVDSRDAPIIAALNADQSTDKGFGPALGPAAGMAAIQRLQALGYQVVHGESDWILGPDDQDIQTDIVNLCAAVARQSSDLTVTEISGWLAKRQGMIAARSSSIRIGHTDFFGLPTGTRSFDRLQSNNTSSPKG
ncbi:MAG TPA: hypothetical protein VHN11_03810, partial [Xanthobacteraceae bacterium]|nr:hypothetical protein [Xanthobacteraceae bacterium]